MTYRLWRRVLGVVLVAALCAVPLSAAAQEATSETPATETSASALKVGPAIIEHVLTPGKTVTFTLQVKNITNFPLPVKGFVRDMNPDAAKLPQELRQRLDASKWFTVDEPDFILQPNQVRLVKGTITAPLKVTPGGHYATIFFQPLVPDVALSPTMAYISARVGVLAFLVVKGDLKQELQITHPLQTTRLRRHGPIDFTFSIRNTGNVHMLPTGFLRIYNWRGREVAKMAMSPGVILPETTKDYTMQWKTDDVVGGYRAELDLTYGDELRPLSSSFKGFWIIPWIEALVALFAVGSWLLVRRKTKRRWRKAWRAFNGR